MNELKTKLHELKSQYKQAIDQLPKLQTELAEINAQRREAQREGDIITLRNLTNGSVAVKEMIQGQHDLISELEQTIKGLESELTHQDKLERLLAVAKQSDDCYSKLSEVKRLIDVFLQTQLPLILQHQTELLEAKNMGSQLLQGLGFRNPNQLEQLEAFLNAHGIDKSAFRFQRQGFPYWYEITEPSLELNFGFAIGTAIRNAAGIPDVPPISSSDFAKNELGGLEQKDRDAREKLRESVMAKAVT